MVKPKIISIFSFLVKLDFSRVYQYIFKQYCIYINFIMAHTDIDECTDGTAPCTMICHNTPGTFTCDCNPGYGLASDRFTCQGTGKINFLFNNKVHLYSSHSYCFLFF